MNILEELHKNEIKRLISGKILDEEPLKKYTSFKIGGPAELLIIPEDYRELKKLIRYLYQKDLQYVILGNGSNLLINDEGISGIVIKLPQKNVKIVFEDDILRASANVLLPILADKALEKGLSGLEFAAGLPATLGGAIVMNAGLGDLTSIGDLIISITTLLPSGETKVYHKNDLGFSYRTSPFQNSTQIILEAVLELSPEDREKIKSRINNLLSNRRVSQPLKWPNAGCIFKNPSQHSAGKLIDQAGAKGLRVGDAQVSTKHANFIINLGAATAEDVLELITKVEELVYNKFKIKLKREVIFLS